MEGKDRHILGDFDELKRDLTEGDYYSRLLESRFSGVVSLSYKNSRNHKESLPGK